MVLSTKLGGAWKEVSSLKVKIAGEWKDVSTLYSKKDGAWVTVYSSGALIEFADYPYPIPVAQGWKYSTDGKVWTTVEADSEINVPTTYGFRDMEYTWSQTNTSVTNVTLRISGVKIYGDTTNKTKAWVYIDADTSIGSFSNQSAQFTINSDGSLSPLSSYGFNKCTVNSVNITKVEILDGNFSVVETYVIGKETYPFSGFVKANSITLSDYATVYTPAESGRKDGQALSVTRELPTSFTNADKGYVCGGTVTFGTESSEIDVYDSFGNRTAGTSLSAARSRMTSFVNDFNGYVCGGQKYNYVTSTYTNYSTVDIYDSSGNRSTGTELSAARWDTTSFVNAGKGYVCGGLIGSGTYYSTVDVYDSSGNRTIGTGLSDARCRLTSFVNGGKGYVCGGQKTSDNYYSTVDVYDSSGNRTIGTSLSLARSELTSFINGEKGYVCGGYNINGTTYYKPIDVYDSSGNRSTGTELSAGRNALTSFVNANRGYVCGGYSFDSSQSTSIYHTTVDIYDSSGIRTTGIPLSAGRDKLTSFINGGKGYVCGGYHNTEGYSSVVDVYYDQPEVISTKLPITEGSTYTLNGESGTADMSKVMEFDSKVTGTIKYKAGDMSPGVRITVVDESGNVVEGATISIISSDWDLSNMTATYTWYSFKGESIMTLTLGGIIGSFPECAKLKVVFVLGSNTYPYDPDGNEFVTIEDNNPNITLRDWGLSNINGHFPDSVNVILYDANDKVIGEGTANCVDVTE